jgi:hypothetical protein
MSRHRLADAEHAADIRAELEREKPANEQLALLRGHLIEFDRSAARFPELDCDRTRRIRAELVAEIEALERANSN